MDLHGHVYLQFQESMPAAHPARPIPGFQAGESYTLFIGACSCLQQTLELNISTCICILHGFCQDRAPLLDDGLRMELPFAPPEVLEMDGAGLGLKQSKLRKEMKEAWLPFT